MTSVERRDRIRASDLYVLFGLGAIAVVLALVFGGPVTVAVSMVPVSFALGLGVRLFTGWRPRDRSLDRTLPDEVTE